MVGIRNMKTIVIKKIKNNNLFKRRFPAIINLYFVVIITTIVRFMWFTFPFY